MNKAHGVTLVGCVAFASWGTPDAHAQSAAQKFGRGLASITCGFLEVPGNIVRETRQQGAVGVPIGSLYGVGKRVTRELVGVYEVVSAPFPVPADFRPILSPEYPWDYFE